MRFRLLICFIYLSIYVFSQAKNDRVTVSFENVDLPAIFDVLTTQTGYFFSYNSDLLPQGSKYSITEEDIPIDQFLSKLLVGTGLRFVFFKDQIIIKYAIPAQEKKKNKNLFSITGLITDENGHSLEAVNVFLDGTTIGTSTNREGRYVLESISPGYYDLVFSYIGYENAVYSISEFNGSSRFKQHQMTPMASELDEVEITSGQVSSSESPWAGYFQIFKEELVGTSENASQCTIENPGVIKFTYHEGEHELLACAPEPILLRNEAMGYRISYFLESFKKTNKSLRYRGQLKFRNIVPTNKEEINRWLRERKRSYLGSWNHFKKSLLNKSLKKEGFRIYKLKSLNSMNVNELIKLTEKDIIVFKGDHWELDFDNYLMIVYTKEKESINFLTDADFSSVIYADFISKDGYINRQPGDQVSIMRMLKKSVRLNLNGQVVDRFALTTYGYWSWERMANLVPLNYNIKQR